MTAYTLEPANHVAGAALARAFGPVPAGEEWSVAVRICNNGVADDSFSLQLRRTDGTNACWRANAKAAPMGIDPYDVETKLTLPAGYELWDLAPKGSVAASYTGTRRPVAP